MDAIEQLCEGDRDVVWKAVMKALSDYSLKKRDQVAGIVVTGWKTTIVPHDLLGPPGVVLLRESTQTSPSYTRTPPRWVMINFEMKRRLLVTMTEETEGKTLVTISRHMQVTYFDGPSGSMNPSAYEFLRKDFDTEEELNKILRTVIDTISVHGNKIQDPK